MPLADVKPGMTGIAKTVFQGDTVEDFDVEVIGVQGDEHNGNILVRCSGEMFEKTGVAHGMSGSPVYIDGRLVGAIAFGRQFDDPHYVFLTPIGRMLRLLEEQSVEQPSDWLPKGSVLQASGFTPYALEVLKDRLREADVKLEVQAINNGSQVSTKSFEPGSAVGVSFTTGDLSLGSMGTVTWVDDENNLLAFGHSFRQIGPSNYFMNKCWVLGVVPNLAGGNKYGNLGEPVGVITQDRVSGIGGQVGVLPDAVPLEITVSDLDRGRQEITRVKSIQDEKLLPGIIDAAVISSVNKLMDRVGGGTAFLEYNLEWVDASKKLVSLERKNMYYATNGLLNVLNQELNDTTLTLMRNKLEPVKLRRVTVKATVDDKVRIAELVKLSCPKEIGAGELLPITVTLKPYRGAEFTRVVKFKVPKDYAGKKLSLSVHGGANNAWITKLLRKQKNNAEEQAAPAAKKKEMKRQTLADYAKEAGEADQNNQIIVDVASKLKPLDEQSLRLILKGSEYKQRYEYDFIIDGEMDLTVKVK